MIDFDREYQPDEFDQLTKDLVKARGSKLDTFEKASLARWKRHNMSARIFRLPDRRLTCWPTDLPTARGPSRIGSKLVAPRDVMAYLRGETDYGVSVGIRFDKTDLDLLRAAHIETKDTIFAEAAASVERDSLLIVQCASSEELKQIIGRFRDEARIAHITLEDLRVGATKPVRV